MDPRLMSDDDLIAVTGKKRYTTQVAWFKRSFGIVPVRGANGRPVVTWAAFEALQARHLGVIPAGSAGPVEVEIDYS